MASLTQWTWVWVNSGSWWWTGGLACCGSWGRKELDTTEWLNWTESWKILSMILLAWEMSAIIWCIEHSVVLISLGIRMRIYHFQSSGHCWVFQICWHIECNTVVTPFFRVLNSSPRIPTHPIALLTAVLFKAHLTSHSRMSDSGWLTTPS